MKEYNWQQQWHQKETKIFVKNTVDKETRQRLIRIMPTSLEWHQEAHCSRSLIGQYTYQSNPSTIFLTQLFAKHNWILKYPLPNSPITYEKHLKNTEGSSTWLFVDLEEEMLGRVFLHHHQVERIVFSCGGSDKFQIGGNGLHFGIGKAMLPLFWNKKTNKN